MDKELFKKALVSVCVGAAIAGLSALFEGLLHLVQQYDINVAAAIGGMIYQLKSWNLNRLG